MTLGLVTFCGYTVVGVVSIVGFVMEKQEGTATIITRSVLQLLFALVFIDIVIVLIFYWFYIVLITIITIRLNNEQRAAIADYFRVYKVLGDVFTCALSEMMMA